MFAIAEAEEARFLAIEIGFDDDFGAGSAKGALETVVDRRQRLVQRHRNRHALAGGKTIGLDDDRRALGADIGFGLRSIVETLVGACRNVVAGADILGEAFGALELGCSSGRTENHKAIGAQPVGEAGNQRRLRADNDEIDRLVLAEGRDRFVILDVNRHEDGVFGNAGIAGCGVEFRHQRRLRQLPGERMNLGLAFQLVDDALDYGGKAADLGKNVGDDFREGKITLPVILAYRRGTEDERAFWRDAIEAGNSTDANLEKALGLITKYGTLSDTIGRAIHYGTIARDALAPLPDTVWKSALMEVIDFCIERVN